MVDLSPALLVSLADIAASLAREVGSEIRRLRAEGVEVAATKSSLADVVTAADREAERMLQEGIARLRPDDGVLGEEGASVPSKTGITWVVDPIDGTVNYLYGLPVYAVSVAATVEDDGSSAGATSDGRRGVAGAVHLPALNELFHAYEGGGAFLNGQPIHASEQEDLALALVGTGFGYTKERRTEQAEIVRQLVPEVRDIRRIGAAAPDLCFVACGRLDAYYEKGCQPWDYAAGALIAREAGATILALHDGERPGTPMMIAAPQPLAGALRTKLREAYAAWEA